MTTQYQVTHRNTVLCTNDFNYFYNILVVVKYKLLNNETTMTFRHPSSPKVHLRKVVTQQANRPGLRWQLKYMGTE